MKRSVRILAALPLLFSLVLSSSGCSDNTITWKPHTGPDLNASLRAYQRRQLERDQQLRDGIRTPDDLKTYQQEVRKNLRNSLGPWPARTPLKPKITGVIERDGYRIEKILIQSQPGFYVPINLYVPTGRKGPLPAVL
jgi:hypothetical protein